MAKQVGEYNGTSFTQSKKLYDYNGTNSTQIKKAYDYNGTNSTQVYASSVICTNLVGNDSVQALSSWSDVGYQEKNTNAKTVTTVNGRRYFLRANLTGFAYGDISPSHIRGSAQFNGSNIVDTGDKGSQFANTDFGTNNIIASASGSSTNLNLYTYRNNSTQGGFTATFYMCVDITELEAMVGRTLTASEVWNYFGNTVFYGSKEITL